MSSQNQSGSSSRKRSSEDFQKEYPKFVLKARKKFLLSQPDSSASAENNDHQIIYFLPFMNYPMALDEDIRIAIDPVFWAKAFMEKDLCGTAQVLSRAVFTEHDLQERDRRGFQDGLPSIEKCAILTVSKWMLNKQQNPWSFDPRLPHAWPTSEEQDVIEKVFQEIDSVYPSKSENISVIIEPVTETQMDEMMEVSSTTAAAATISLFFDPNILQSDPRVQIEMDNLISILENLEYDDVFKKIGNLGWVWFGNASQTVKELTKITIPTNTDIFVDAVQFTKGRWVKAFSQKDVVSMAEVLFRKYWKTECDSSIISSVEDLCPVRRLAILRAVAWMKASKANGTCKPTDYDSNDPSHNFYPSDDEVEQIESRVFKKYLGTSSCAIDVGVHVPILTDMDIVETENQNRNGFVGSNSDASSLSNSLTERLPNGAEAELLNNSGSMLAGLNLDETSNSASSCSSSSVCSTSPHSSRSLIPRIESDNVVLNDFKIARNIWDEALRFFTDGNRQTAALKAGKLLFANSFTVPEMQTQTYSGRGGKPKLNREATNGILDSLAIMGTMNNLGISTSQLQGQPITLEPRTLEEKQTLITKIFSEYRNYLSNK